jgi:hypothetical protein
MQRNARPCNANGATQPTLTRKSHGRGIYVKPVDERKRPIRGLWIRNGSFYARLVIEDSTSGKKSVRRVRLEKADTVAQAQAELRRLLTKREDGNLPAIKLSPKFSEFADHYLEIAKACKRPGTVETEMAHLNSWKAHLGDTRLAHIKRPAIDGFITKRKAEG